jgi:two-component system chemotaxis response regulator CheY
MLPLPGRTILVVDDDPDFRELLVEGLCETGHDAVGLANALEAFEYVADHGIPMLVIMDLTMPVMDGRQFLAERRKLAVMRQVPLIVLTANAYPDVSGLDASEVVQKPFDPEKFLQLVDRYCAGRSGLFTAARPSVASK